MKTSRFFLAVAVVALFSAVSTVGASAVEAFVGPPTAPDTTRTDTFAQAGFGFFADVSGAKQVNQLGFWVAPEDSGNTGVLAIAHSVALYRYNGTNYTQITSGTVAAGGTADSNGYAWVSVPAVTLTNNGQGLDFYIVMASVGTDVWAPFTGSAHAPTLDPSFGTRTGNGWFSTNGAPGDGLNFGDFNPVLGNGGYFGPNVGFVPAPGALPAGLFLVGMNALRRCRK